MAPRRSQPPQPPASIAEGSALVRDFVVKLYDQRDGQGVNWPIIAETLFQASFDVLDRLPNDRKWIVASRVHEGSYCRITGEDAQNRSGTAEARSGIAHTGNARAPRPPR